MQKLTSKQLEVMKEAIEKRNNIASMTLQEYYKVYYFINNSSKEWEEAKNNIVSIHRYKYRYLVCKHLEQKQYIKVLNHNALYIWVKILKEV